MVTIHAHLEVSKNAKESLTLRYEKERWIDIGESPNSKALVDKALERISSGTRQYDVFIEMLKEIVGMDIIWENIEGTYVFVPHQQIYLANAFDYPYRDLQENERY